MQNNNFYFLLVVTKKMAQLVVRLIKRAHGADQVLAEQVVSGREFRLKVAADEQDYHFYFANQTGEWQALSERVDGRILSTPVAGGFDRGRWNRASRATSG